MEEISEEEIVNEEQEKVEVRRGKEPIRFDPFVNSKEYLFLSRVYKIEMEMG